LNEVVVLCCLYALQDLILPRSYSLHVSNIYVTAPGNFVIDTVFMYMYHEITFFTGQNFVIFITKKAIFTT